MFNQRVEEAAVKQQVGIPGRFFIGLAVAAGIRRREVEHDTNLTRQAHFTVDIHRPGVRQHNIKGDLSRQFAIFFTRIMEVI